jgi:flagellar basal-body rod protein FlgG
MYTAATAMQALLDAMGIHTNNIANVKTTAFKRSQPEFVDLLYQTVHAPGQKISENTNDAVGQQIGTGVRLAAAAKDFRQGSLVHTVNNYAVAIQGEGFFEVTNGDEKLYTRDGSFKISEGNIITSSGHLVAAVTIPAGAENFKITPTGLITYTDAQGVEQEAGNLQLAIFANPVGLSSIGDNLYRATAASGQPVIGNPGSEGAGVIKHQFLEGSNVVIVTEMVKMLETQRAYELCSKMLKASSDMQHTVIQVAS